MKEVKLKIQFCSQCPFGRVMADPDPDDWFCDDDERVYCTKLGRNVASALRPYEVGKIDTVPEDCPMNKEEIEKLPKVRCWAARDKYGLEIYSQKPEMVHGGMYSCDGDSFFLDNDEMFPELKAGDEPVEIEIFIRKL